MSEQPCRRRTDHRAAGRPTGERKIRRKECLFGARWASLSVFFYTTGCKRSAERIVRQNRMSLIRRIVFPWITISLTGELVGGIVQGVHNGDEVFGPPGLDGVLANESVEFFCEAGHDAVLPAAIIGLARSGRFALGQIRGFIRQAQRLRAFVRRKAA